MSPPVSRPLRVAILGTGGISRQMIDSLRPSADVEVAAIGSRSPERAAALACSASLGVPAGPLDEILQLDTVDAVYVGLPTHVHADWTARALSHGKHVLCEKPLVEEPDQATALYRLADAHGCVLAESFPYRHTPLIARVEALLAAGAIGVPRIVQARMSYVRPPEPESDGQAAFGGGALSASGSYCCLLGQIVFRREPVRAYCTALSVRGDVDQDVFGIIEYGGRAACQFMASFALPAADAAVIFGDEGIIELPIANCSSDARHSLRLKRGQHYTAEFEPLYVPDADGFRLSAEQFARQCRQGLDPATRQETLGGIAAHAALRASLRSGGWAVASAA